MMQLNSTNLTTISDKVRRPSYDFNNRQASIVHFGTGAFHKAHQATFTEDMLASSDGNHRIIGVSLRSPSARDLLKKQDFLYTAIQKSGNEVKAQVVAAIKDVLVAPESPQAVIELLADDNISVITSTITEKGYCLLPGNTGLDINHPDIQHDLGSLTEPKSMIGFVVQACLVRKSQGKKGFTFVSCDNLPDNSQVAGKAIMEFAAQVDDSLVQWLKTNVTFCNSMVDRIVPAVTAEDLTNFERQFGYKDEALVTSEPFRQWVIEDNFARERPPWDKSGVLFVEDVALYEKMKLRFLNGSHSALAYLGKLTDHQFIHQAMSQPVFKKLVAQLMRDMTDSLSKSMTFDFDSYGAVIVERFLNDQIQYQTQQVATDGSQKLPQRILAPLAERLSEGYLSTAMCLVIAGWLEYLSGQSESGNPHPVSDPMADQLQSICQNKTSEENPDVKIMVDSVFAIDGLFPQSLKESTQVRTTIVNLIKQFRQDGVLNTINAVLD